jgi:hypothetical protein
MKSQILPCPHCGKELMVIPESVVVAVRSIDSHGRSSSTIWRSAKDFWDSLGEVEMPTLPVLKSGRGKVKSDRAVSKPTWAKAKPVLRSGQSFDHAAAPAFPWAGSGKRQDESADDQGLKPGETHKSRTFRERHLKEVLITNAVTAGLVGGCTLFGALVLRYSDPVIHPIWVRQVQWWIGHRWFIIAPASTLATAAFLWLKRQLPSILDGSDLMIADQEHTRHPDPQPIEVKPPAVALEFNERNEHGRVDRQVRAVLSAPANNHDGLWRYCAALAREQAFPSLEGGKSGPGAAKFGYTGQEFDAWRKEAERAGLLEAPRAPRQPWTITERGQGAFARIGQQQQQEASYAV